MRLLPRALVVLLALPLVAVAARARPQATTTRDEWHLVMLDDAKCGFAHEVREELLRDGRKLERTTTDSSVTLNRFDTKLTIEQKQVFVEDEAGRIVSIESESNMAANKTRVWVTVKGAEAEVVRQIAGPAQTTTIAWSADWLGPRGMDAKVRRHLDAGDAKFELATWSPDTGATVMSYEVLGEAATTVPGAGERPLLRLRATIDIMPGMVSEAWLDPGTLESVMTAETVAGMRFVTVPSDKAACLEAFADPETPEIFAMLSPRSNVRLPAPYETDEVVLRLTSVDGAAQLPELEDERQTIVERRGENDVVLRVRRIVPDRSFALPLSGFTEEELECLEPNLQIECAAPEIVALAREAVGGETDAWKAAGKLEAFVRDYITKKGYGSALHTALEVVKSREGDCTEHGVLLAALCRAAGIPARVAVGLLYHQGIWAGHMWTEVSLGGAWYALDGVLGSGSVDAAHLRLAADSLKVSELNRAFGNVALGMTMKMDLVSFRHGDRQVEIGETSRFHEVAEGRYRHLLFGFSVAAPAGWEIRPNTAVEMGDNEVVEFAGPEGQKIEVQVIDVPYDFALDQIKGLLEAQGISRVRSSERELDGRKAVQIRARAGKQDRLASAVLDGHSLVLVVGSGESPDAQAFEAVVQSLDLDG